MWTTHRQFLATCECGGADLNFYQPTFTSIENDAYYLNEDVFVIDTDSDDCPNLCVCDVNGNCYQPTNGFASNVEFIPYCSGRQRFWQGLSRGKGGGMTSKVMLILKSGIFFAPGEKKNQISSSAPKISKISLLSNIPKKRSVLEFKNVKKVSAHHLLAIVPCPSNTLAGL